MKKMLINALYPEEIRVALVEDSRLVGLLLESTLSEELRGSIFKGRIAKVHQGLNAFFVDYGRPRHGLLPMGDVRPGSVPGLEPGVPASACVRAGMEILVQVVREEMGDKGALLTTDISLPGRFLVLLPGQETSGVSRKIEDARQRLRLRTLIEQIRPPEGMGVIVRTAGMDRTKSELLGDLSYLVKVWRTIKERFTAMKSPGVIYREGDVIVRALRDHLSADTEEILVDDDEAMARVVSFLKDVMPSMAGIVRPYRQLRPIFAKYDLEKQIESVFEPTVRLPGGGSIVIEPTEAMVVIDVNSGHTNASSMEETALETNLEAASEIARQLVLRDLGGLVVVDFIDMRSRENIKAVEKAMREALRKDRARVVVGRLSKFGILELSRERLAPPLWGKTHARCGRCGGTGIVRSTASAGIQALREMRLHLSRKKADRLEVSLPHDVCMWLLNEHRAHIARLEEEFSVKIVVTSGTKRDSSETRVAHPA